MHALERVAVFVQQRKAGDHGEVWLIFESQFGDESQIWIRLDDFGQSGNLRTGALVQFRALGRRWPFRLLFTIEAAKIAAR